MTRIWWILIWALKILKISTKIGSFCAKYITFNLSKYRGVMFHDVMPQFVIDIFFLYKQLNFFGQAFGCLS